MIETFLVYASRSIEAYLESFGESSLHLEEASGNPGMWYILFNIRNYFERKNHLIFMMQQPIVRILDKTMRFLLSFHICITIEKLHYIVRMCMCPPEHPMCNGSIVLWNRLHWGRWLLCSDQDLNACDITWAPFTHSIDPVLWSKGVDRDVFFQNVVLTRGF